MKDMENFYVLKIKKTKDAEFNFLGTLYADSISTYESIDGAIKFPESQTPKNIGQYITWRYKYPGYKVYEIKTTMEEIREDD